MSAHNSHELGLMQTLRQWWKGSQARAGVLRTARSFAAAIWGFACESTPERRRRRYGDVDFDWAYRVDTTSATVGWRDRLLGTFHSPYQPTEPALFQEMFGRLEIDFREFTFIDLGSGKGRVLLMAAAYPFRRVFGVELLPELHRVAEENIRKYKSDAQRCLAVQSVCGDAREFLFPPEPTVLYLFNPLPEAGMEQAIANLERSLRENPHPLYVLYHNPLLEHVLNRSSALKRLGGTEQYLVYASAG